MSNEHYEAIRQLCSAAMWQDDDPGPYLDKILDRAEAMAETTERWKRFALSIQEDSDDYERALDDLIVHGDLPVKEPVQREPKGFVF